MKSIRDSIKLFRFNLLNIIIFEVIIKVISFAVLIPLYYSFISFAIKLAGVEYLSKETAKKFFKAPSTYGFLALSLIFAAMYIMINVSGLCYAYNRAYIMKKTSAIRMLISGLHNSVRLLRPKNMPLLAFVLCYVPIIGNVYLNFRLLNIKAPYIVDLLSMNMRITIGVIAVYVILLIYNFRYTYLVQVFCVERKDLGETIKSTKALLKGSRFKMVGGLILWCIIMIGIPVAVYFLYTGPVLAKLITSKSAIKFAGMIYEVLKILMSLVYVLVGLPLIYCYISNSYFERIPKDETIQSIKDYEGYDSKKSRRTEGRILLAVFVVALILDVGFFLLKKYDIISINAGYLDKVTITAHRGDSAHAPENTIPAFEKAIENGADVIELDVRQTQDGEIVIMHDENIKRTCGVNKKVGKITYDELLTYNAAENYKGKNKKDYDFVPVPTLREAIETVGDQAEMNIELKPAKTDTDLVEQVVEILHEYDYVDNCVVTSPSYKTLQKVKELDPDITTVYVMSVAMGDFYKLDAADAFSVKARFINNEMIKQAHDNGKEVYAWTIDTRDSLENMMLLNVDSIITNNPDKMRRYMYENYYGDTLIQRINSFLGNQL